MLPSLVEHLKSLNLPISKEWIYAGRPCSPRVLFTFENCPRDLINELDNKHAVIQLNLSSIFFKFYSFNEQKSIEKMQHALEDQIYNSLRKSYVITNISNNSLFAIPANQEFAYIHRLNSIDTNKFLLATLYKECTRTKDVSSVSGQRQHFGTDHTHSGHIFSDNEGADTRLFVQWFQ